jgi:OmpA-OmpF porin, OOP family
VNKEIIILAILSVLGLVMRAQNLVVNGSFEQKSYCPSSYNQGQLKTIANWTQASDGTPDYFNSCSTDAGVPKNVFGVQNAQEGVAYAGLVVYSAGGKFNYREYLQTKLTRPLSAGEEVCIEMYVSAADYCVFVTDGIAASLSLEKISADRAGLIKGAAVMSNPRLNMLDECEGWMLISDIYKATGGEQYLTIGNFKQDRDLKIIKRTKDIGAQENDIWSYMYIDNVAVKPVKKRAECSCENEVLASMVHDPPLELEEYEKIKLDAILFDFDEDILSEEALKQLDDVYKLLKKNKAMYIEIDGHADVIGNDVYNLDLSKRRANQVIRLLSEKGIASERLTVKAFGSSQPIAENSSEEGRAQNRRVEFQILEKKFTLIQ